MQQIVEWLQKLGLGQYAHRFAENDVNFGILPYLTDQDLKELGITSLGHRRQLLLAIAELHGDQKSTSLPSSETGAPIAPHDTAERRQVTVMFSALVGSTALSAPRDPEDLREVISTYQKCVAETVRRLGGFVAQYMGDGVLIYFGYPRAHEDDAERAVRAGLELVASIRDLKTHVALQTRVGIATGMVVVGDLSGSGADIVGETPNLAARLQAIAEPDSVVIAESTRKLMGNLFELKDLGAQDLKGIAGPVRAWAALRPSSAASRFEALHASGLTELVGRQEELHRSDAADLAARLQSSAEPEPGDHRRKHATHSSAIASSPSSDLGARGLKGIAGTGARPGRRCGLTARRRAASRRCTRTGSDGPRRAGRRRRTAAAPLVHREDR